MLGCVNQIVLSRKITLLGSNIDTAGRCGASDSVKFAEVDLGSDPVLVML